MPTDTPITDIAIIHAGKEDVPEGWTVLQRSSSLQYKADLNTGAGRRYCHITPHVFCIVFNAIPSLRSVLYIHSDNLLLLSAARANVAQSRAVHLL